VVLVAIFKPRWVPALPLEARTCAAAELLLRVLTTLVPPLLLIFLVLGTIFLGIATPTEGGAMGATGALIMALARRRLSWSLLKQAMETTAKLTTFVVFILVGARVFSLTFYGVDGHKWVEHLLTGLPGGEVGFLIVVNVLVFLLAFFLDFFELSFIVVPLLGPVAQALGIDLIWFGVLLAVNMQTSFMHPPFGFRALLPAFGGAGLGQDHRHLLGSDSLRLHSDHHGRAVDLFPATGDLWARQGCQGRSRFSADRNADLRLRRASDAGGFESPKGSPADAEDAASKAVRDAMKQDQAK
jgi:hypothetical protein